MADKNQKVSSFIIVSINAYIDSVPPESNLVLKGLFASLYVLQINVNQWECAFLKKVTAIQMKELIKPIT